MPRNLCLFVLALNAVWTVAFSDEIHTQPEQVHISYGVGPTQMMITWLTINSTNQSIVEYGLNRFDQVEFGKETKFIDGGSEKRIMYVHRVLLKSLQPDTTYRYHCGSNLGWSEVFWFTTMKEGTNWSPRFAVYGDMGNVNAQSLTRLQEETQRGMYDAILHVGDMAYDMDTDNARVGDEFMRQIEPVAAYIPYMTCVGNHENAYNFSNYVNRFSMMEKTGKINNHFYSFDIGPAHIISFSTEFYFYLQFGWRQVGNQYKWLEDDLKEATRPENRAKRPWIITMGHRPMYCSMDDKDDCTYKESIIRTGFPLSHEYALEDLFYKYGVDLEFWAHEHVYERLWPVYDRKVYNGSYEHPYTDPKAPVHIITGSAGCQERHDPFSSNPPEWSAIRNSDYGYTRLNIINKTHLYTEQVSDDKGGEIVDRMLLIKNTHGPQAWL